ncbi:MAG: hypothetical protein IT170_02455 [Bryobacterales bacterium]|nr:hypothetical protein [Bryobacterales bacterium]
MTDETGERIRELHWIYRCEDPPTVEGFLRANPDLLPYVEQSEARIAKHFPKSNLRLVVEHDEGEDGSPAAEKLFILIEASGETADALDRLEKLDEDWSVDVCEATDDRLVIDLSYERPLNSSESA